MVGCGIESLLYHGSGGKIFVFVSIGLRYHFMDIPFYSYHIMEIYL